MMAEAAPGALVVDDRQWLCDLRTRILETDAFHGAMLTRHVAYLTGRRS